MFKRLLHKTHISKPLEDVLDRIEQKLYGRMLACSTPDNALKLYEEAQNLPGTTTNAKVLNETGITMDGPLSEKLPPMIVRAVDKSGRPLVLKILVGKSAAMADKVTAYHDLNLSEMENITLPLVCLKLLQVSIPKEDSKVISHFDKFQALSMPYYSAVLTDLPQLQEVAILQGAQRMKQALEYIHNQNYVHLDIKGANIFIDNEGKWFLGDFGSAKCSGDSVESYTRQFYPEDIKGKPAHPKYDWCMLLVALAVELNKKEWMKLFDTNTHLVVPEKIVQVLNIVQDAKLKLLLQRFFESTK